MSVNSQLSSIFAQLASEYEKIDEPYRAKAYRNASLGIARYAVPITSGKQAQNAKIGVGKSTAADIDEYLTTGTLSRLQQLGLQEQQGEKIKSEKDLILESFEGIYGVGPATSNKWYNAGYRTIEDLANVPKTHAQTLGYHYYYHLKERIPRSEMDQIAQLIHNTFSSISICNEATWRQQFVNRFGDLINYKPIGITISQYYVWLNSWLETATDQQIQDANRLELNILLQMRNAAKRSLLVSDKQFLEDCNKVFHIEYMICGSYRRGLSTSGDVDCLIKGQSGLNLSYLVTALTETGFLIGNLAEGKTKYLGIGKLDDNHDARRIDLMIVNPESWAYATLYFTGSQKLNIAMRNRAIELGLTLNEYGLYNSSGQSYPATTEQQIFEYLGLQYLEPQERSLE
jgi:DNA polymerase/3'-5' exonuclease PolX